MAVTIKDTRQEARAATVDALLAKGELSLVGEVLKALGVEEGVRVETLLRVPPGSGLGATSALALAVAGGVSAALGRPFQAEDLWPGLREAEARAHQPPVVAADYATALHGGVQAVSVEGGESRSEPLPVDPARIEESLFLIDAGDAAPGAPGPEEDSGGSPEAPQVAGEAVRQALLDDRFEDVVGLLRDEWEVRKTLDPRLTTAEVERAVNVAQSAGGAARLLSAGGRAVMAIWAPPGARGPGRREAVTTALEAAAFRVFPARVDLRGLEVG